MTLLKITSQLQDLCLCFWYICVCPSLCLRLEARAASHAPKHPWPGARVLPWGRGGGSCEATGRRHIRCAPQSPARPREPAAGELEARLTLGNLPRPPCVGINRDTFQPETDNMATWLQTSSTDFKICNDERNHDVHDGVNTFDPMHMITEFSLKAGSPKIIAMVFRAASTQPLLKTDLFSCWLASDLSLMHVTDGYSMQVSGKSLFFTEVKLSLVFLHFHRESLNRQLEFWINFTIWCQGHLAIDELNMTKRYMFSLFTCYP